MKTILEILKETENTDGLVNLRKNLLNLETQVSALRLGNKHEKYNKDFDQTLEDIKSIIRRFK